MLTSARICVSVAKYPSFYKDNSDIEINFNLIVSSRQAMISK